MGLILRGALLAALGVGLAAAPVRAQTPVLEAKNADEEAVLQVNADGGLLGLGVFETGVIPAEGAGTRLMWHPAKAAFRAGRIGAGILSDGSEWDEANVGAYSVALGLNARASGTSAVALGSTARADGSAATALGQLTTASGRYATAMGSGTTASGNWSTVMGDQATASGRYATAMGRRTTASGNWSTVMGDQATASGRNATAMGRRTTASGQNATALGSGTTASGQDATALGDGTTAQARGSLAIGRHNVVEGDEDSWVSSDPLFVAGNGTFGSPSNALTLRKNGNLTIAGNLTQSSDRRLKTDIAPLESVLAALEAIQPVRYRFREGTSRPAGPQLGLIAQEVEEAFPELVTRGGDGYLSVAYPKLTAVLLKGLQEQQDHIEAQQTEIEALRAEARQVDALEARLAMLEAQVQGDASVIAGWSGWGAAGLFALLILGGVFVRRFGS